MTGRDATSVRRDRLVLAAALLVPAVVALGLARHELDRPDLPAARSPFGTIDLLTDDAQARATLRLSFPADGSADESLLVDVGLTSRRDTVAFALVLGGDAARTGVGARSASVLPRRPHAGDLWAGRDAVDAWWVNHTGPALVNFGPPSPSAVVVGHARRAAPGRPIRVSMSVPTTSEFLRTTDSGFGFHLPTVGSRRGRLGSQVLSARPEGGNVAAPAAELIEEARWQPPRALHAVVVLSDLRANDHVDASPPATRVGRGLRAWQGSGPLEVTGVVDRAADIRRAQHRQFVAGVAVGVAGALVVGSVGVVLLEVRRTRLARGDRDLGPPA
jgi:hypothetical protein